MVRKFSFFIITVMFLLSLYGCAENNRIPKPEENNDVPTLLVEQTDYILLVSESVLIEPSIEGDGDYILVYNSYNENIATVVDGIVKAIAVENTKITINVEGYPDVYKEINVTVEENDNLILEEGLSWAKEFIGTELSVPKIFPLKHPNLDVTYTWESSDQNKLTDQGLIKQSKYDEPVDLKISVYYNGQSKTETINIVVTGTVTNSISNTFYKQFSSLITRTYTNITTNNSSYPNAEITWYSSNSEVFSNDGVYTQPFDDTEFYIYLTVSIPEDQITKQFVRKYVAQGVPIYEKAEYIKNWALNQMNFTNVIHDDLEFPVRFDQYNATLSWSSDKPDIISSTGMLVQPNNNELVKLTCQVTIGDSTTNFYIDVEVEGKQFDEKWDAVNAILDIIFKPEITNQRFTTYGVHPSFLSYNYGYLPFFINESSVVIDGIIPLSNVNRPGRINDRKYVVIHDTANNSLGADAEMHNRFIKNATNASWHYTVDDTSIYQHIPDEEVAWHAGTSEGNNYGIGIETTVNLGVDYNVVMRKTAKLTSELLYKFNLSLYNVKQHYDFSGKDCPRVMRASNRWNEFLDLVAIEYLGKTQLNGVEFEWKSLSPSIMDNTGKIIKHPEVQQEISYEVKVTYAGVTKIFTNTSILLAPSWI